MTDPTPLSDPDNVWLVEEPEDTDGLTDAEYDAVFSHPGGVDDRVRAALLTDRAPALLLEPDELLAAADVDAGAMIALVPSDADLDRLAVDDGEPRDQLHLTLWYLGDAASWPAGVRDAVVRNLRDVAAEVGPVSARVFGTNLWNADTDEPAWVYAVGDDPDRPGEDLGDVRALASPRRMTLLGEAGDAPELPDQHSPWVPHVCAAYSADPAVGEAMTPALGPVTLDRLRVAFGGDVTDVPLGATAAGDGHAAGASGSIRPDVTRALESLRFPGTRSGTTGSAPRRGPGRS